VAFFMSNENLIRKAKKLLEQGNLPKLQKVLSTFPASLLRQKLELELAVAVRQGLAIEVREALFDEYIAQFRNNCSAHNLLLAALVKVELSKWPEAGQLAKTVLEKNINSSERLSALEISLLAAFNTKNFQLARNYFELISDQNHPAFAGQKMMEWDLLLSSSENRHERVIEVWQGLGLVERCAVGDINNLLAPVLKAYLAYDRVDEAKAVAETYDLEEKYNSGSGLMLSELFKASGEFEKARLILVSIIQTKASVPEAEWNLALLELTMGNLDSGWEHYKARWRWDDFTSPRRYFDSTWWDGIHDLNGKSVLIWGEQGVGDQLRFLTLLPNFLKAYPSVSVFLEIDERLCPIVARWYPEATVQPYGPYDTRGQTSYSCFDYHFPSGDLGIYFFNTEEKLAASKFRALRVPDATKQQLMRPLHDLGFERFVGICWRSSLLTATRVQHYFSVEGFMTILKDLPDDVGLICLQIDLTTEERAFLSNDRRVYIPDIDFFQNIDAHAIYAGSCDILVTCRSIVATLAGLFGVPVISWMKWEDPTFLGQELHPWFPNRFDVKTRPGFDKRALARRLKDVVDKYFS